MQCGLKYREDVQDAYSIVLLRFVFSSLLILQLDKIYRFVLAARFAVCQTANELWLIPSPFDSTISAKSCVVSFLLCLFRCLRAAKTIAATHLRISICSIWEDIFRFFRRNKTVIHARIKVMMMMMTVVLFMKDMNMEMCVHCVHTVPIVPSPDNKRRAKETTSIMMILMFCKRR